MTHHTEERGRAKVIQMLEELYALESALVGDLTLQIALAPRGELRDRLEHHHAETRAQAGRIAERLDQLGATRSPIAIAYGGAQFAGAQAITLARAPLALLRGLSPEEKVLKNAKDAFAAEATEIAAYTALERIAEETGDEKTAVLAREHRGQEDRMANHLRELLPQLAADVTAAEVRGEPTYDVRRSGAADALRLSIATIESTVDRARLRTRAKADELIVDAVDETEEQLDDAAAKPRARQAARRRTATPAGASS